MVGNSVRSDILPVMALGGHGVHVPYHLLWELEHVEHNELFVELDLARRAAGLARPRLSEPESRQRVAAGASQSSSRSTSPTSAPSGRYVCQWPVSSRTIRKPMFFSRLW